MVLVVEGTAPCRVRFFCYDWEFESWVCLPSPTPTKPPSHGPWRTASEGHLQDSGRVGRPSVRGFRAVGPC